MKIEEQGIIFDAPKQTPARRAACFTSLGQTAQGTLFCGFHVGATKHSPDSTIALFRSRDRGRTWQELPFSFATAIDGVPGSLSGGDVIETVPGRLMIFVTWFDRSDRTKPLFDPETSGILPSKLLAAVSTDEGTTWGPWQVLPTGSLKGCGSTGPALQWSDGRIAYPFESYKEMGDPAPSTHGAWFVVSADQGRTWGPPFLVAQHPQHKVYYWDQRLCPGPRPGEYYGLFWTHDLERKKDLRVHFTHGVPAGKTIQPGPIVATSLPGQIAAPLREADGRLYAFVVDRDKPSTMTLWSSRDDGATWPESLVIYTHDERSLLSQGAGQQNVDFAAYWEDMGKWSFGHPAIRSLDAHTLFLAYYAGAPNCLSIRWARVNVG